MYIEFYGLPGAGKTIFAEKFNEILNKDSNENHNPYVIIKTIAVFAIFLSAVILKMISSHSFFHDVLRRPVHFAAFLKGMLVRFIVVFRHERSGFFISDHGLIQTLSQNDVFRRVLIEDRLFLCRILGLLPKKHQTQYVHLKSETELSMKRVLGREHRHVFSQEFLNECSILFRLSQKFFRSENIRTDVSLRKMEKDVERILKKHRFIIKNKKEYA